MMIACPVCNFSNPGENRFCGMCGGRLERRRTPDSELLPEDSEHSGPASELPRAAAPSGPQHFERETWTKAPAAELSTANAPVTNQRASGTVVAEPPAS